MEEKHTAHFGRSEMEAADIAVANALTAKIRSSIFIVTKRNIAA
jgi:hypothetical protein